MNTAMVFFKHCWLLMSSKICNNTSNKGLSHHFLKKQLTLCKEQIWKENKKTLLLNDEVVKNKADVIILIARLMLKFLVKSKNVFYQDSSDLVELNSFYSSFSDAGQKSPTLPFKSSKKPVWYRVNS